ncbi:cancer-associated 1 protein-like isoform X2 [Clarias magur]|uniref:Cancer-associated 1 protein-like isoform X2 n=1 Tax=Clarias magur TaxID=1594786 RepID=A0A8J4UMT8_CLAMG|nr:cancer-associated 1 protein-like isoform X2 [Clarias magur]
MAKEEVRKSETQVNKYGSNVPEYESKITQIKCDISQKDEKLKQTREGIWKVKKQIKSVAEFQMKARSAAQLLGVLGGRASVAEYQTRRFILQKPVVKVMEDMIKATEQITGNELLNSNDMPRLISKMKENNQRLAAICASESNSDNNLI